MWPKDLRKQITLLLLYFLPFMTAEMYLRAVGYAPSTSVRAYWSKPGNLTTPTWDTIPRYPNPKEPGHVRSAGGKKVNTNGFISEEFGKSSDDTSIYIIGDSLVEAREVEKDIAYYFKKHDNSKDYLKMSLSGANAPTYLAYIDVLLSKYKPHRIYIIWSYTDFFDFHAKYHNTGLWFLCDPDRNKIASICFQPKVYNTVIPHILRNMQSYSSLISTIAYAYTAHQINKEVESSGSLLIDYESLDWYFELLTKTLKKRGYPRDRVYHIVGFNGCLPYKDLHGKCQSLNASFNAKASRYGLNRIINVSNISKRRTNLWTSSMHPNATAYSDLVNAIVQYDKIR